MNAFAAWIAAGSMLLLALPPQWCCLLPALAAGRSLPCCPACVAAESAGERCGDSAAEPCGAPAANDPAPRPAPCTCGKAPLKQPDKPPAVLPPPPRAAAGPLARPAFPAEMPRVDGARNLQQLLCRWRC